MALDGSQRESNGQGDKITQRYAAEAAAEVDMQGDVPAEVRMTDLLGRLEAHACLHDELCRHDPEQTAFAADLRAAKAEIERLRAVLAQLREYTDALNN